MRFIPATLLNSTNGDRDTVPVFVISLAQSQDRRDTLIQDGLPETWVNQYWPARDLRDCAADRLSQHLDVEGFVRRYGRAPIPAEVGCLISHTAVRQWLAHSPYDLALVFEDDAAPTRPDWRNRVTTAARALLPRARRGVALLGNLGVQVSRPRGVRRKLARLAPSQLRLARSGLYECSSRCDWYSHAVLLSRAAAQNLSSNPDHTGLVADDWQAARRLGLISEIYHPRHALFTQHTRHASLIGPR